MTLANSQGLKYGLVIALTPKTLDRMKGAFSNSMLQRQSRTTCTKIHEMRHITARSNPPEACVWQDLVTPVLGTSASDV